MRRSPVLILGLLLPVAVVGSAIGQQGEPRRVDSWPADELPGDTIRYTLMPAGITGGERSVWLEAPSVRCHRLSYRGAILESRVELDRAGLPLRLEITGRLPNGLAWEERFERRGDTATWSTPDGRITRRVTGPAYYASPAYEAAFGLSPLARVLLGQADRSLPLLPDGTVRLEPLGGRRVEVQGRSRNIRHYALHGLDLAPEFIWLDEDGSRFADEVSILAGWEPAFPELHAASADAAARHGRRLFAELIPPARERPLVIRGARLFDAESGSVREGTTILVRENRIAAVGADGSVEVPDGAEVIDAAGRTVLPIAVAESPRRRNESSRSVALPRSRTVVTPAAMNNGASISPTTSSSIPRSPSSRSRSGSVRRSGSGGCWSASRRKRDGWHCTTPDHPRRRPCCVNTGTRSSPTGPTWCARSMRQGSPSWSAPTR